MKDRRQRSKGFAVKGPDMPLGGVERRPGPHPPSDLEGASARGAQTARKRGDGLNISFGSGYGQPWRST
jgi:hypothetical protein